MADKSVAPHTTSGRESPTGFYVLMGVMGLAFLLIVGYMVYLYLS